MKAKHRHELKTNELAEWLMNFPQWAKENLTTIIYVSVLIVVVAGLYIWRVYNRNVVAVKKQLEFTGYLTQISRNKMDILRAHAQGVDFSYILLRPADGLRTFAQNTKNNTVAALALIKRAQALRTELHYRQGTIDSRLLTTQINLAKESYNEAIPRLMRAGTQGTIYPSLMAMAKFGLGLCEEELANFSQARQIYRDIVANPDFECTVAAVQAQLRLDTMAGYQEKLILKPSPKPMLPTSMRPEIELSPVDVNLIPEMPKEIPKIEIKPVEVKLPRTKPKATDTNLSGINLPSQ